MSSRIRSIALAGAVVVVVVAVIAVVVTRDGGGADAYTVDGRSVSQKTVSQELSVLVANELVTSNGNGSVDARAAAQWLTTRIRSSAVRQLLETNDLELTATDRSQIRDQLPAGFARLPQATQDLVLVFSAGGQLLVDELGEGGANEALAEVARGFDVSVDPKYGRWVRARAEVCPPLGCVSISQPAGGG